MLGVKRCACDVQSIDLPDDRDQALEKFLAERLAPLRTIASPCLRQNEWEETQWQALVMENGTAISSLVVEYGEYFLEIC